MIELALVEAVCRERRETALPRPVLQEVKAAAAMPLRSIRIEVHELKAAIGTAKPANESGTAPEGDRMAQIEARLARIEARLGEQDEMFATILSKMIEWIDEDEALGKVAHRAA